MGINSNAITAGSPEAAPTSFQARAPAPSSGPVADSPNAKSAAGQASDGSAGNSSGSAQGTGAAGGNGQSGSGSSSPTTAQKTGAPSAQTRGNARPRARNNAVTAASTPTAADALETEADPSTDFGSVMATALGHSAASSAAPATSARSPSDDGGTSGAAASTQPGSDPAGTPVDAIAWIAQALMPTSTPALPPTSAASAADSDADIAVGTSAANAAGAGQSAATLLAASLARFNAANDSQSEAANLATATATTSSTATATASGGVNMLADIQKLISGMTGASTTAADNDADAAPATPTTHSAATGDSNAATQAAAALQAAALTRSGGGVGSATLTIQAPVGSAAFADEVGARVTGLAQSGITQAQLQMNPADLGPVQVHITMQAGQASVWFGATHADTRAALEQSLPRLRELFAGAGMPLTDSGVFREPPQQQQALSQPTSSGSRVAGSDTVSAPTVTQVTNIRLALLDTYA